MWFTTLICANITNIAIYIILHTIIFFFFSNRVPEGEYEHWTLDKNQSSWPMCECVTLFSSEFYNNNNIMFQTIIINRNSIHWHWHIVVYVFYTTTYDSIRKCTYTRIHSPYWLDTIYYLTTERFINGLCNTTIVNNALKFITVVNVVIISLRKI